MVKLGSDPFALPLAVHAAVDVGMWSDFALLMLELPPDSLPATAPGVG